MFSEYASKFLSQSQSQSQSRLSPAQPDAASPRSPSERHRLPARTRGTQQQHPQRRANMSNPYASQQGMSRFAFASRTSNAPAPLFYSATDDFREEDDHDEHDREMADQYALQRSRRQFGAAHLSASSEADDDLERSSDHTEGAASAEDGALGYGLGRGIKSSWRGDRPDTRGRNATATAEDEERDQSVPLSESSDPSSRGHGNLVDVELASTIRDSFERLDRDEADSTTDRPPSFQQFKDTPQSKSSKPRSPRRTTLPIPEETEEEELLQHPHPESPPPQPQQVEVKPVSSVNHNLFWAELFVIVQCAICGVFLISLLQESPPDKKHPIGDTIYTVLHASFRLIGIYSLVSVLVGLLWLSLLRSYVRLLISIVTISVPVISTSFFLYSFISSYKGYWHGGSTQDKAIRWLSFGPLLLALFWTYTLWKGRHSFEKAATMLEFCGTILQDTKPLIFVGVGTLAAVILWSWIWMGMFVRLFLGGHLSKASSLFIIDLSTWWLGVAFFLDYFWVLAVIAGIQRATTAAAVSQWYFHRKTLPTPPPRAVVHASLKHAATTMAGTICLSTLLALLVRLPLLALPRRITGLIALCINPLVSNPIASLTNPLTLTYASIHGLPLADAARRLAQMAFISPNEPTTTLGPRSFATARGPSLVSYRLAKLLLHAIRWVITLALGFGGWVSTAHMLQLNPSASVPYKGSAYAYVVGLISAAIGWGALGAMEGVVGGVLDAALVCWGAEAGSDGEGEAAYCREAGELFGGEVWGAGRGGRGRWDV